MSCALSLPPTPKSLEVCGTRAFTLHHFFLTDGGSHAAKYFPQKYRRVEAKQLNQNILGKERKGVERKGVERGEEGRGEGRGGDLTVHSWLAFIRYPHWPIY